MSEDTRIRGKSTEKSRGPSVRNGTPGRWPEPGMDHPRRAAVADEGNIKHPRGMTEG